MNESATARLRPLHAGLAAIAIVFAAMVLSGAALFTGTVWALTCLRWPIGFHAAWAWGQTCFFGVGDSGIIGAGTILQTTVSGPAWLSGGSAGAIALGSVLSDRRQRAEKYLDR